MNAFKVLFLGVLLYATNATAQYGNNYGYGSRNNNMPAVQQTPEKATPAEIEKARNERVDKIMTRLQSELILDELQFIAIKNDITSSTKSIDIVMKSENSDEDKNKEIKAIQDKTEKSILSYLNPSQKEKYQKMKEDRAVGKSEKKKKRKDKEETTE
ncbi:hypothetical protein [Flavobacterium phycosphaerae]|uniref:hypothetical protein n=1 Tax=Flavobacterium phycosphaerae TaxID=2697515 RepID=UPI00138A6C4F|nr:hypothetical protein [Flavobacterium phycosphaerae]